MIAFTNGTTSSPLLFYYRLEDTPNFNGGNSATNTPWINGNSTAAGLTLINATTVNNTAPLTGVFMNSGAGNSNSYSNENKILTIGGNLATFNATNNQVLYCRIGLPMNTYSYFSNINAVLS